MVIAILLIAIGAARIASTWTRFCFTNDEPQHFACGIEYLEQHVYRYSTEQPPLSRVAMALAPFLDGSRLAGHQAMHDHEGIAIMYQHGNPQRMLTLMRLGILPFFLFGAHVCVPVGAASLRRSHRRDRHCSVHPGAYGAGPRRPGDHGHGVRRLPDGGVLRHDSVGGEADASQYGAFRGGRRRGPARQVYGVDLFPGGSGSRSAELSGRCIAPRRRNCGSWSRSAFHPPESRWLSRPW